MPGNVLRELSTRGRILRPDEFDLLKTSAEVGFEDAEYINTQTDLYRGVLESRRKLLVNMHADFPMHAFLGYAMGMRKGAYGLPEEIIMLWNELSTDALPQYIEGLSTGIRIANDPLLGSSIETKMKMATEPFNSNEEGAINDGGSAQLLGQIAGVCAVAMLNEDVS